MLKLETLHTQVIDQDNKGYKSQPNYLGSLASSNVGCTQVPPFSRTFHAFPSRFWISLGIAQQDED